MPLPELFERTRQSLNLTSPPPLGTMESLPGTPTVIPFTMQDQKADLWCWAAVAASVSQHYSPSSEWTQCLVAETLLGVGNCCLDENSPSCNVMATLEGALEITSNLATNGVQSPPLPPEEIREQIRDLNHVIGCGIRWEDLKGHFVVIHGFSIDANGTMWLAIADPKFGPSEYPLFAFLNRYRDTGTWEVSYATEP